MNSDVVKLIFINDSPLGQYFYCKYPAGWKDGMYVSLWNVQYEIFAEACVMSF